jgi:DNA adenine methylase
MSTLLQPQSAENSFAVITGNIVPDDKPVVSLLTDKSLLRYPGGKTRAIDVITQYFPKDITEICSPFLGGASIELFVAASGVKVHGYDVFRPLVEFWQCAIKAPCQLSDIVRRYYPLKKAAFYELQQTQIKFKTKMERAGVFYVLNRSSFSGSTLSGGMSPDHPRFTESSIERLRHFYNPNLEVNRADFKESITSHRNVFTYLDPPYLIASTLYGKKGDTHKDFDHVGLAKLLKKRSNWIMSYNDCKEIRELYAGYRIIMPEWKYGMSTDKTSKEVLIFSQDITPDLNANPNRNR